VHPESNLFVPATRYSIMQTASRRWLLASAMLVCFLGVRTAVADVPRQPPSFDQPRVWTDVSGKFSRTAVLIEVGTDAVRLRQPSGRHSTIAWDKLSAADQQYAREFVERSSRQVANDLNAEDLRIWTDATGRHQATARLIAVRGDLLVLVRPSGKFASARLENLSREDREFERTHIGCLESTVDVAQSAERQPQLPAAIAPPVRVEYSHAADAVQPSARAQFVAHTPFPLVPPWDQQSAPSRVIQIRVTRRFLDQFVPHDVNTTESVQDVIVGTPVRGTSMTQGRGSIELIPNPQQAIADIFFTGSSQANTVSDSGRAQISSYSTTTFQARKRIVLDADGLHLLPTNSTACSNSQTGNTCSSLPGLRGAITRRVAARRNDDARWQANQEAASHFEVGLNRQLDRDVASLLAEVGRFQRTFFAAARQGGLNLCSQCSSTAESIDVAIFRGLREADYAEPMPPAIPGDPPAALWIHNSFLQHVLTDSSLRAALDPLVAGFLAQSKTASPDGPSSNPLDWSIDWSRDGSWLTVSFGTPRLRSAAAGKRSGVVTVAVERNAR
jgi:hypothetical protein